MILEIVSPDATLFKDEVTSVSVPGSAGSFQMLNNHAPIVSLLQAGKINISANKFALNKEGQEKFVKVNDQNYSLDINSGTVEMKDNKVVILID